ncbi:P-loop NTPase fold protein [Pedobacter sp. Du54]|uniref:P-loop NTPase fold protein n=1 Tax=Pedobacter anseongensis TaxID=3133439 RepID=UPI0030B326EE
MPDKLFIAFHQEDQKIFDLLDKRLNDFAIVQPSGEITDKHLLELVQFSGAMVDIFLFLFTEKNINSEGFLEAYKEAEKLTLGGNKRVEAFFLGDLRAPKYFHARPHMIFKRNSDLNSLAEQVAAQFRKRISTANSLKEEKAGIDLAKIEQILRNDISHGAVMGLPETSYDALRDFLDAVDSDKTLLSNDELKKAYLNIDKFRHLFVGKQGYYLLKLNPGNWIIPELKKGYKARFHSLDLQNRERVDYQLFKGLKIGDQLIGFAFHSYMSVVCVFKICKVLSKDPLHGEGIELEVVDAVTPNIQLEQFSSRISFRDKIGHNAPERIFAISKDLFDGILGSNTGRARFVASNEKEAGYSNDSNFKHTTDQLDFQDDIDSFAAVIALKNLTPPLAIGLFGEWGTGKSFFMEKLSERIDELSKREGSSFVKNIVHVKFNAWHYSDTNLWPSLVTHIFEKLNDHARNEKFDQESVRQLYAKLDLASVEIIDTSRDIEKINLQAQELQTRKTTVESILQRKKDRLEKLNVKDIMGAVLTEPEIEDNLKRISEIDPIKQSLQNIAEIRERLSELDGFTKRIAEVYSLITKEGKWWHVWLLFVLATGAVTLFFFPPFQDFITPVYAKVLGFITTGLVFLKGLEWVRPYIKQVEHFYSRLKKLKEKIEEKAQHIQYDEDEEISKLTGEIEVLAARRDDFEHKLESKTLDRDKVQTQIDEIGRGKKITTFLEQKSGEHGYHSELGVVSKIRKDFTLLSHLFNQQKAVEVKPENFKEVFTIDRIVLYVDDLDRCCEEVVMKTLEAIHLLLAFELFVVVVGVDSFWLNKAVDNKFTDFFERKNNEEEFPVDKAITSYDFMEKIFQVPFALKPMTDQGKRKLIAYLTEPDLTKIADQVSGGEKSEKSEQEDTEGSLRVSEKEKLADDFRTEDELVIEIEERVTLTADEVKSIQDMGFIFGHTPRTIKRFINTYRIIRAHKGYISSLKHSKVDYMPTLVLLSVVIGCPLHASRFIGQLKTANHITFSQFIEGLEINEIKSILQQIPEEITLAVTTDMLRENLELVARFSFRT